MLVGAYPAFEAHHPGGCLLKLFPQPRGVKDLGGAAAVTGEKPGVLCPHGVVMVVCSVVCSVAYIVLFVRTVF